MKLHLGCGMKSFGDDWVHIDGSNYPHIHSHDIVNLPFEENTVDLIYLSHVFEYFDRDEAVDVLSKWKKVLKPGGKILIVSFHSIEDKIVKYFFKNLSQYRSISRYEPEIKQKEIIFCFLNLNRYANEQNLVKL